MSTPTSIKPKDWQEGRRFRAWELKQQGWKQDDIAKALGVSKGAVSQWVKRARQGGQAALRRHPAPGPTPRLTQAQLGQIPTLLSKGAEYYGFIGQVWTAPRVATVIKEVFGVRYHETHVRRILKSLDWSSQKPIQRATQRDEAAIASWQAERWPALKKRPRKKAQLSSS